ncbi:LLM class F420-dependent oxidoreductase [Rhodococcus sp. KBS0724]|uniref:LLM class F420-dependent oxidoreductase n=1 Tax=Rhodococcus sp. KBS0724 TaxID=1179674 RepID=UPI00110F48AF|nr:LLM class F420-dependent oxidoreductase [Rhodococcus sp. KBS0724]TSD40371.1 LLM class F420-dependent oxidoreductase [Rhodococcus sp. KBS0724]
MRVGVVYPQTEMRGHPGAVRAIASATEEFGYSSFLIPDHPIGADPTDRTPPLLGPYTEHDTFHDPFVLFGYLSAITSRIELVSGVLILPERQTAIVARQVADADILSGGRIRLGVGTGWNHVEYSVLAQDFQTRGARLDEQLILLRELWTSPLVTFDGRFHSLDRACINPRPTREIPIYLSGNSEPAYRRAAREASGFIFAGSVDQSVAGISRIREHLVAAGRDADDFDFEIMLSEGDTPETIVEQAARWRDAGGTQVDVITVRRGFQGFGEHVEHLRTVSNVLGLDNGVATRL